MDSRESESDEMQQLRNTSRPFLALIQKQPSLPNKAAADRRHNRTTALLVAMAGAYAVLWLPFTLVSVLIDLDLLGVVKKNDLKKSKYYCF